MSRTARPILEEHATVGALRMIEAHVDGPCPTRREVTEWTGVTRRQVWAFLAKLQERGLIEIEVIDPGPGRPGMPRLRRMRVINGQWTGWTARFQDRKLCGPRFMAMMDHA